MIFTVLLGSLYQKEPGGEERGKTDERDGRREKEKKHALETLGAGVPDKAQLEPPGNLGSKTTNPTQRPSCHLKAPARKAQIY